MDWLRDIVQRLLRDLPLLIAGGVVATLLIMGIAFVAGEPLDPAPFALWMLVAFVAFVPLRWMRLENPLVRSSDDRLRRTLGAVGLGCLWAVLTGGGALVLLAILGPD